MVLFRSPASLTDLVTSIQAFDLPSMDKLRVVGDSLSQIQDWFDDNLAHTLGEVKRKLAAIMTQGTAVFRVSDVHGMALEIHFPGFKHSRVVNHVMTEEQLDVGALPPPLLSPCVFTSPPLVQNFLQPVIFNSNDPASAESKETETHVDTPAFLAAIGVLRSMRNVAADLFAEAHVQGIMDGSSIRVNDLASNRSLLGQMQGMLSGHRRDIAVSVCARAPLCSCLRALSQDLRRRHPLLSYLLLPQALQFVNLLCRCKVKLAEGCMFPALLQEEVCMFLRFCGLDVVADLLTPESLACPEFTVMNPLLDLEYLGAWLAGMAQLYTGTELVPASVCMAEIGASSGAIGVFALDVPEGSPTQLFSCVRCVYGSKSPHWSQVLWCTRATSAAALVMFFERCASSPDSVYTLVSPDALPRGLWDTVCEQVLQLVEAPVPDEESKDEDDEELTIGRHGPRGRLAVVFSKNCSLRRVCVNHIQRDVFEEAAFIPGFACLTARAFVGRSGDGKSFALAKEVAATPLRRTITVRVNEGFTLEGMVSRLCGEEDGLLAALAISAPVTFVFHVSAYAPFAVFDAFLFMLFVTRSLHAPGIGGVICLPSTMDVAVLVEVPNPLLEHDATAVAHPLISRNHGAILHEGTVGGAAKFKAAEKPLSACLCLECVSRVNLGVPFDEKRGCAHLVPSLTCLTIDFVSVSDAVLFEVQPRFRLALRMLKAFITELPVLGRAVMQGKITMVNACGPCCPPRYLIDAIAVVNDTIPGWKTAEITPPCKDPVVSFHREHLDSPNVLVSQGRLLGCLPST